MNATKKEKMQFAADVLRRARMAQGDMTVRRLQTLLEVALRGETNHSQLIAECDMTTSGLSKTIASWGRLTAYKTKGPGFLSVEIPDEDMRSRVMRITPKGDQYIDMILGED